MTKAWSPKNGRDEFADQLSEHITEYRTVETLIDATWNQLTSKSGAPWNATLLKLSINLDKLERAASRVQDSYDKLAEHVADVVSAAGMEGDAEEEGRTMENMMFWSCIKPADTGLATSAEAEAGEKRRFIERHLSWATSMGAQ